MRYFLCDLCRKPSIALTAFHAPPGSMWPRGLHRVSAQSQATRNSPRGQLWQPCAAVTTLQPMSPGTVLLDQPYRYEVTH